MTGPSVRDLVVKSVQQARDYRRQARRQPCDAGELRGNAAHCMRLARCLRIAGIRLRAYP